MESIGTLAGGIAHDLNNILAPILLAVLLLSNETPRGEAAELTIIEDQRPARRGHRQASAHLCRGWPGAARTIPLRQLVKEMGASSAKPSPNH